MENQIRILLVEDDDSIVLFLRDFLQKEGFAVDSVDGQQEALYHLEGEKCDVVLLDVSLKQGNGFSACKAIKEKYHIPVIFLTASDDEYSVVTGLDLGADDYISKPFRPRELISRIHSVLRRSRPAEAGIRFGDVEVFPEKGLVRRRGVEVVLSAMEYRLLLVLVQNRG